MLEMKRCVASCLVLAVLGLAACDRIGNTTDKEFVQRAKEAQEQGKLSAAEIELKNALQKNPENAEARRRLGEVYIAQGRGKMAEEQLLRAKSLGTGPDTLTPLLGEAYLLQGLYTETLASIQPAAGASPEVRARILEIRGRASAALNRWEEACSLFAESLQRDARYVASYRGVARCDIAQGQIEKARADLNKAFELDSKDSATWVALGDLERAANRPSEAEVAYSRALEQRKDNLNALVSRATLRIENNKLDEASKDVQAALAMAPGYPLPQQLRGVILYKQGKFSEAQTSFESALRTNPNYLPSILWLGLANFAQANYEQAAVRFGQFVRVVPSIRVQALLGLTQAKMGLKSEADSTLNTLRNVNINDPQSLATLAQAHMAIREFEPAQQYLKQAVEQKPDVPELRFALATAFSQKGQRTQAIEQLEDAIRLDPGMANAEILLIQNLIRDKQFDKALQAVQVLEKKEPKNPTTFNLKGAVYLGMNDAVNARKSFEQAASVSPDSVAAAMNLAQLDLLDKNPDAARQRFEKVLAKNKQNVDAMVGLARLAATLGQEAEYVSWLEKAAQAGPSAAVPRVMLANYYLQKKDFGKALELSRQAQSIAPNAPQVVEAFGAAQLAAGQKENALISYRKLVSLVPNSAVAHYKLASTYAAMQDISSARASLNRALILKPDYEDAEILLASAELGTARYLEAQRIAQQIQKQHPNSLAGLMLEGDALMGQKQFLAAQTAYAKAFETHRNGLLAIRLHQARSAAGNVKDANAALIRWLEEQPNDVAARVYLARNYATTGQTPQAIEQYERLLQSDAKNAAALNDLAWLYQKQRDPRALAIAEQAQQLRPDRPEVADTLGWILVQQGQTARGLEILRKALELAPQAPAIRYHFAAAVAKNGDKLRARRELETLLAKDKKFPERDEAEALLKTLTKPAAT